MKTDVAERIQSCKSSSANTLLALYFNFATIDLIALCRQVLSTMKPIEKNCASVTGKTYLVRIAPYKAIEREKEREYYAADIRARDASEPEEESSLRGVVLTFVDTTKQVNDQQQIEEMAKALRAAVKSGREKETFLSHMSHDMRTPMTAIIGFVQLTLQRDDLSPEVRENLEKIQSSGRYLMSLIDEVLETSRINAGKAVTVSTAVRETHVIEEVNSIISQKASEAGPNMWSGSSLIS